MVISPSAAILPMFLYPICSARSPVCLVPCVVDAARPAALLFSLSAGAAAAGRPSEEDLQPLQHPFDDDARPTTTGQRERRQAAYTCETTRNEYDARHDERAHGEGRMWVRMRVGGSRACSSRIHAIVTAAALQRRASSTERHGMRHNTHASTQREGGRLRNSPPLPSLLFVGRSVGTSSPG